MIKEKYQFESWNLHDATLKTITVDWPAKSCTIMLVAFLEVGRDAIDCAIRWDEVSPPSRLLAARHEVSQ